MIANLGKVPAIAGAVIGAVMLSGCSQTTHSMSVSSIADSLKPSFLGAGPYAPTAKDRECMERVMFFESNRSSRDGMIAVGTVVMNRLRSGEHGSTICEVVAEPGQFAPGVMTRPMNSRAMPDVEEAADAVLKGERASKLKNAMHFHTAGLKFPYKNMHYVLVAGGNAFYEKRDRGWQPLPDEGTTMIASAVPPAPATGQPTAAEPVVVAEAATVAAAEPSMPGVAPVPARRPDTTLIASASEPDPSRFGQKSSRTVWVASYPDSGQPTMSFQSTPSDTSSIGALIASESRPMEAF